MSLTVDTSEASVERLAAWARFCGRHMNAEPIIRALATERDEAQAEANAGRQAEHDADQERDAARALLHTALRHIERVSVLLNDLSTEMHRLDDAEPEGSTRFDALAALLLRRFTDCSGLPLFIDADNAGLLPDDLQPAAEDPDHG